jgi:hypothetical protein
MDSAHSIATAPAQTEPRRRFGAFAHLGADPLLIATAITGYVMSSVQWATPNIIGIDGYYHIRMASMMRERGWAILLPMEFPWLPTTILNPAEFTNHHLLFHLLLVPFTFFDVRIGAKLAAVIFSSVAMLLAVQLMISQRVRFPLFWLLVLLGSAYPFLYRLSMTRRQAVTMCLLMAAIYLVFSGRRRWLIPLGFAFIWLFDGFPLLMGVATALFIGDWWQTRRPDWRIVLYPAVGVALGMVIHPYFPHNLEFSYLHMLPKVLQLVGLRHGDVNIQVGTEWYPYNCAWLAWTGLFGSGREGCFLLQANWLALALVPLGLIPILADPRWSRLRQLDGRVVALMLMAFAFFVLFLRSRRWIEAEPLFAMLFCAFAWNFAQPEWLKRRLAPLAEPSRLAALLIVGTIALLPLVYHAINEATDDVVGSEYHLRYRGGATWLIRNSPPGSCVLTTDWDDFPEMFYWNTHNTYLIGLDPTYMYLQDGAKYLLWRQIGRGQVEQPSEKILATFNCGYVFTDRAHQAFLRQAAADPGLAEVFRDEHAVVFVVKNWKPSG